MSMNVSTTVVVSRAVPEDRRDLHGPSASVCRVAEYAGDIMPGGVGWLLTALFVVRRSKPVSTKEITTCYLIMRVKTVC